ncbi:HAMP domain-containing sensor histidine kinase [Phenylobacterium sp. LjRoot219]|uniref:sensor histidine kinase n=1 Tax=Phenylobacterium sp. LjRoot219 TaxID=3342283 RepID=UPI003ECD52CB
MTTQIASGAAQPAPMFDDQKRSFLRVVSHELRTPLNSILGFSEILASELYGPLGTEQYRQYAEIIRSSGEKLLNLVNQVVEIARLQMGDIELNPQPQALGPIIEALGESSQQMLTDRRLRLQVELGDSTEVLADSRALRTILTNLMQNAIAFSPEDAMIAISAQHREDRLEIVVRNEGAGVDPNDLPRLLRPFEQGQNALTRHGEGAGLGLAICNLACQAMGGRLRLVSAPGEGFAAHIELPAA